MLFDLKGKRRRTVQVTYIALAFLMAVGLVGAGVGSGTSGGIFDLFGGGSGKSNANKIVEKRIKAAQRQLLLNPKNQVALTALVRAHYDIATADQNQQTGAFGKDGRKELLLAGAAWTRYLSTNPKKPDASLAAAMLNAFGARGLNRPADATTAAEIIASAQNTAQAYLRWTACATAAGQTRKANLAAAAAAKKAGKAQAAAVTQLIKQATNPTTARTLCSQ